MWILIAIEGWEFAEAAGEQYCEMRFSQWRAISVVINKQVICEQQLMTVSVHWFQMCTVGARHAEVDDTVILQGKPFTFASWQWVLIANDIIGPDLNNDK